MPDFNGQASRDRRRGGDHRASLYHYVGTKYVGTKEDCSSE